MTEKEIPRLLCRPITFAPPRRLVQPNPWSGHIPFAFWLIEAQRPRRLVELGTHTGNSYCAFLQAVDQLKLTTECFAIDTWEGDAHNGRYGEEIFQEFSGYHNANYSTFSKLIRSTFDEAVGHFTDKSIDLLHIDGLHTYDAVKHDFLTWLPKLSDQAVVLFHDTNVRKDDFGVWKYWDELAREYPNFNFMHSHGLGVLGVGENISPQLRWLLAFNQTAEESASFNITQSYFERLGLPLIESLNLDTLSYKLETKSSQLEIVFKELKTNSDSIVQLSDKLDLTTAKLETLSSELETKSTQIEVFAARLKIKSEELSNTEVKLIEKSNELDLAIAHTKIIEANLEEALRRVETLKTEKLVRDLTTPKLKLRAFLRYPLVSERRKQFRADQVTLSLQQPVSQIFQRPRPTTKINAFLRHPFDSQKRKTFRANQAVSISKDAASTIVNSQNALASNNHPPMEYAYRPLVSIIMPVFNVDEEWLLRAVDSVRAQTYTHWELCICDDASAKASTIRVIEQLENSDPRIRIKRLSTNSGISLTSNHALSLARGEFIALLDNDDELAPRALESCILALNNNKNIDVIYSDEDKLSKTGKREEPFLKSDWSPTLFRELMYVGHLLFFRRTLLQEIGEFNSDFDGVQDYELMLRLSERTSAIHHIHEVLYHWRRIPGSIADNINAKRNIGEKQAAAVNGHLARMKLHATAHIHPLHAHRIILQPLQRTKFPHISILIPTKDAPKLISTCLTSIFKKTTYPDFEVIVIDNNTTDQEALNVLTEHSVKCIPFHEPFNYSRANNLAAAKATGEFLVFLNNDTEVVQEDWLEQMLFFFEETGVGAVGPMLLYPDRKIQHAGIGLGMRGTADHVMRGFLEESDGYFGSVSCSRDVSAVTFACAMVRKKDFHAVGGLNEFYATHYQDLDFCLRLKDAGFRTIYTPRAKLIHYESATRGSSYDKMDRALLLDRWRREIAAGDRYSRRVD